MTLLVLGLAVPASAVVRAGDEGGLLRALIQLGPSAITYVMSFITLGIFWVGQQTQLKAWPQAIAITHGSSLVLLAVTLVPFSTSLLARFIWSCIALAEYWLNIVVLGGMLLFALEYGLRRHLFRESEVAPMARLMRGGILIAQSLYAVATVLSIVLPTWVSMTLIVLIQLNYVIAPRIPFLHRY